MKNIVFTKICHPVTIWTDENGTCWISTGYDGDVLDADTCTQLIKALTEAREAIRERYGKNK